MRRKIFLTLVICMFAAVYTSAQEPVFRQNDNVISFGIGIGGTLYSDLVYTGSSIKRMPTISFGYERCIIDNLFNDKSSIGAGGILGYTSAKYNYGGSGLGWKSTDFMIGARGAFHYALVDNLDTYAGTVVGYNFNSWKWTGEGWTTTSSTKNSGITFAVFVGGRYYIADVLAVFAEIGYGYTIFNTGIALKF